MVVAATGGAVGGGAKSVLAHVKADAADKERVRKTKKAPRAAKGASSVRSVGTAEYKPSRPGPMRFPVGPNMPWRHKLWMTLDDPTFIDLDATSFLRRRAARHLALTSVFLIVASTFAFLLETDWNCKPKGDVQAVDPSKSPVLGYAWVTPENCEAYEAAWATVETVTVVCFSIEILVRAAVTPDRARFLRLGFTWIDLMAVLPWYLGLLISASGADTESDGATFLKVLRVFRLARIFKLMRIGNSASTLQLLYSTAGGAFVDSLQLLVALFMVMAICTIVFSSGLFSVEPGDPATAFALPGSGEPEGWFLSIPRTLWWALVTLTGVGYGDEYPMKVTRMPCSSMHPTHACTRASG